MTVNGPLPSQMFNVRKLEVSSAHHDAERQRRSVLVSNDGGMAEIVVKSIEGQELDSVEEFRLRIYYKKCLVLRSPNGPYATFHVSLDHAF